jgi:hypothetical protein
MPPDTHGFFGIFAVAEIICTGEKLFRPIDPSRSQQFLCADQPEINPLLITDQVLSAIATGKAEITRAVFFFVGEITKQTGVFIIRMRRYVQHRSKDLQLFHLL